MSLKLNEKSIIDCLKANYGIAAALLTLLPIGADMNASVYKGETKGSQSYFVKLKRGHRYDMSVAILTLLQLRELGRSFHPSKQSAAADPAHRQFHSYCIPICRWTEWILQ